MLRAVVKNTFLAIQAEDEAASSHLIACAGSWQRAMSADAVLTNRTSCDDECDDGQLDRLNNLISLERDERCPGDQDLLQRSSTRDALEASEAPSVDELQRLQRKLSDAMTRHKRVTSNSSISTMADGEGLGLHHVWSSGSVNTMVSDSPLDEDGGMDFGPIFEEKAIWQEPVAARREPGEARPERLRDGSSPWLQDFSHSRVPKSLNLAEEFTRSDHEGPPTTMMIRNIPNRYTQRELIRELEHLGFGGAFDFLYVPVDKGTMCNVGYAFVNFLDHDQAARCMTVFDNYSFAKHRKARGKIATVSVAYIQGLEANIRHYEHAAVSGSTRSRQRGPVIMASIAKSLAGGLARR